ncbi:MAG: HipA family kinase [Paludibacter sp.]
MQTLKSIQTADRLYNTGDRPVLVMCSDMQDYVCKYAQGGNATNLYCEYVAASFLRIWKLPVPDFAFVNLNYEHVKHFGLPKHYFDKTCFGSKYSRSFQELTHFTDNPDLKKQKGYLQNRDTILRIALFDLWIANEDRNYNNLNLLIDVQNNYNYLPIDHGAIFNTRSLDCELSLLTENECLTDVPLMKLLFQNTDFNREYIQNLKEYFYLCTLECKNNFDEILNLVPENWNFDLKVATHKINNELFDKNWEAKVMNTFLEYINSPFL